MLRSAKGLQVEVKYVRVIQSYTADLYFVESDGIIAVLRLIDKIFEEGGRQQTLYSAKGERQTFMEMEIDNKVCTVKDDRQKVLSLHRGR